MADAPSNHAKAPVSALFVKEMRTCFPELVVRYVSEGSIDLGERDKAEGATCEFPRPEKKK